ncbi:MAG: hypothetical protein LBD75_07450 [Candidatus Peribacteria bacterium]|nr:hypothetical protein [Candidatus Peribacteria bacterium]
MSSIGGGIADAASSVVNSVGSVFGARASGGGVFAGQMYKVNELGNGEYFVPAQN